MKGGQGQSEGKDFSSILSKSHGGIAVLKNERGGIMLKPKLV